MKTNIIEFSYKNILKPILFRLDPEFTHDLYTKVGEILGQSKLGREITSWAFNYQNKILNQNISGINFKNPVGLSAGFDYNARLTEIIPEIGFGFETLGAITNMAY